MSTSNIILIAILSPAALMCLLSGMLGLFATNAEDFAHDRGERKWTILSLGLLLWSILIICVITAMIAANAAK